MNMRVHKSGCDILPCRVNDLRVITDAVICVTDQGDTSLCDRHIDPFLDLSCTDIH